MTTVRYGNHEPDTFQANWGITLMGDVSTLKFLLFFRAHAVSVVLNFSENCTPYILMPYLDGTMNKLLVLLQVYDN